MRVKRRLAPVKGFGAESGEMISNVAIPSCPFAGCVPGHPASTYRCNRCAPEYGGAGVPPYSSDAIHSPVLLKVWLEHGWCS
jgi:hypothetical protein